MNVKRMADQYRKQVSTTGERAQYNLNRVAQNPGVYRYQDESGRYLGLWYHHLKRALGDERSLGELRQSRETILRMKKVFPKVSRRKEIQDERKKGQLGKLADTSIRQLNRFLEKLPRLIEKSLSRSVREADIRP